VCHITELRSNVFPQRALSIRNTRLCMLILTCDGELHLTLVSQNMPYTLCVIGKQRKYNCAISYMIYSYIASLAMGNFNLNYEQIGPCYSHNFGETSYKCRKLGISREIGIFSTTDGLFKCLIWGDKFQIARSHDFAD
jgi:hypothetical protein